MTNIQTTASNTVALLEALYQMVDSVNEKGGPVTISGIAACKTLIDSLNKNRARMQTLIINPLVELANLND